MDGAVTVQVETLIQAKVNDCICRRLHVEGFCTSYFLFSFQTFSLQIFYSTPFLLNLLRSSLYRPCLVRWSGNLIHLWRWWSYYPYLVLSLNKCMVRCDRWRCHPWVCLMYINFRLYTLNVYYFNYNTSNIIIPRIIIYFALYYILTIIFTSHIK